MGVEHVKGYTRRDKKTGKKVRVKPSTRVTKRTKKTQIKSSGIGKPGKRAQTLDEKAKNAKLGEEIEPGIFKGHGGVLTGSPVYTGPKKKSKNPRKKPESVTQPTLSSAEARQRLKDQKHDQAHRLKTQPGGRDMRRTRVRITNKDGSVVEDYEVRVPRGMMIGDAMKQIAREKGVKPDQVGLSRPSKKKYTGKDLPRARGDAPAGLKRGMRDIKAALDRGEITKARAKIEIRNLKQEHANKKKPGSRIKDEPIKKGTGPDDIDGEVAAGILEMSASERRDYLTQYGETPEFKAAMKEKRRQRRQRRSEARRDAIKTSKRERSKSKRSSGKGPSPGARQKGGMPNAYKAAAKRRKAAQDLHKKPSKRSRSGGKKLSTDPRQVARRKRRAAAKKKRK